MDQAFQMDSKIKYPSTNFREVVEKFLNHSQSFTLSIDEKRIKSLISKYDGFFQNTTQTNGSKSRYLPFWLRNFEYKTIEEFFNVFLYALSYGYKISLDTNEHMTFEFVSKETIDKYTLIQSIDRKSFPVIDFPSKDFYKNAVSFLQKSPYLMIRIDKNTTRKVLINELNRTGVIEANIIFYPISLKAFLDYTDHQLAWNRSYYIEDDCLYVLISEMSEEELIKLRSMPKKYISNI